MLTTASGCSAVPRGQRALKQEGNYIQELHLQPKLGDRISLTDNFATILHT